MLLDLWSLITERGVVNLVIPPPSHTPADSGSVPDLLPCRPGRQLCTLFDARTLRTATGSSKGPRSMPLSGPANDTGTIRTLLSRAARSDRISKLRRRGEGHLSERGAARWLRARSERLVRSVMRRSMHRRYSATARLVSMAAVLSSTTRRATGKSFEISAEVAKK